MAINEPLNRKLRMALVGGGQGSFIGAVHATAAVLDNRAALVAGALSSNPERSKASAPDYDIADDRAYGSVHELVEKESAMPEDQRVDLFRWPLPTIPILKSLKPRQKPVSM
jgi:predicted dehydrogenase